MTPDYKFCPLCAHPLVMAEREGHPRLRCSDPACAYVHWDNPLPVVAAIIEHEGKVLLARNRDWPEKMFGLVTGFLEKGETPEAGVLREVAEETGLKGTVVEPVGVYPFFQMNQIILAYHVRTAGDIHLGTELAEYKLLPAEKVRTWPSGTGQALGDWLRKRLSPTESPSNR